MEVKPVTLKNGLRAGVMRLAPSKSHAHRVLMAEFLAGRFDALVENPVDCDDIAATKRCLRTLADAVPPPVLGRGVAKPSVAEPRPRAGGGTKLDVGESGTTRRLLGPVVAALGVTPEWIMRGRLASRPQIDYADLKPGVQELPGDVSSQFVSGLLFALPILKGDSEIRLTTPLASRGYVNMTLDVLKAYGIVIEETDAGFKVPGNQKYVAPADGPQIEGDWSGAAFILALAALGNDVTMSAADRASLKADSLQPDKAIEGMLEKLAVTAPVTPARASLRDSALPRGICEDTDGTVSLDVDACPDIFPILTVVAACRNGVTRFTGTRRLKIKESDRTAAMADVLGCLGVACDVGENEFVVKGTGRLDGQVPGVTSRRGADRQAVTAPRREVAPGTLFPTYADHRIAMSIAVAATRASAPVSLDNTVCAAKSFPTFFEDFETLALRA